MTFGLLLILAGAVTGSVACGLLVGPVGLLVCAVVEVFAGLVVDWERVNRV